MKLARAVPVPTAPALGGIGEQGGRQPSLPRESLMFRFHATSTGIALAILLGSGATISVRAADAKPAPAASFGALQSVSPDAAREQALAWFKTTNKADADALKAFDVIWASDRA